MSPLASGRRRIVLLVAACAIALVVLVVVLASGSDDDDALKIVHGSPDAGFPLRGDLKGDDGFLHDAAAAWRRRVERDGDEWENGDEVVALWEGELDAEDQVAVLAADGEAALVTRRPDRPDEPLQVDEARTIRTAEDPRIVAFDEAVLVASRAKPAFRPAETEGQGSPRLQEQEGLFHRGGTALPEGALLFPDGLDHEIPRPSDRPAALFTGREGAVRILSKELLERLTSGEESRAGAAAQRLRAAALAPGSDDDARRTTARFEPYATPELALVADRPLDPIGRTLLLQVKPGIGGSGGSRRPRVVAATGGSSVAGVESATAVTLGGLGDEDDGARAPLGPAMGASYVRLPGQRTDAYLLVAGDDEVRSIEVLAGNRRYAEDGPLALFPATWTRADASGFASAADVAVLGRTRNGRLVVPSPPAARAVTVKP